VTLRLGYEAADKITDTVLISALVAAGPRALAERRAGGAHVAAGVAEPVLGPGQLPEQAVRPSTVVEH
jgi:hypothetical protein